MSVLKENYNMPTQGSNILDLVITSAPEHIEVTEVLPAGKANVFTDHCVVLFEYNSFVNASSHPHKFVYDYPNGNLKVCVKLSRQSIFLLLWVITI